MKMKKIITIILTLTCIISLLAGCTNQNESSSELKSNGTVSTTGEHEPITITAPFRNISAFMDLVNEKYPEINLEVIPYSGANTTAYVTAQLKTGDMPDIYCTTIYLPGLEDLSDKLLDLSGYSFTSNYAEARLADVSVDGSVYLLPTYYTCIGITYNKTLLEKNGWKLPTSFKELEELAPKVKEAGYNLALNEIQLPGYGFQYLCNVLDTDYLNTLDGRKWQRDFINGKTTASGTPAFMDSLKTLDKWRDLGMLNNDGDENDDNHTKAMMAEGNTLFLLGSNNAFSDEETTDEFGLMPFLSEDGSKNSYILNVSRYVGLNKNLAEKGNEQKLEDAVHVMEIMSTVEGLTALNSSFTDTSLLPLKDYVIPDTNYYKAIQNELDAGYTAPFIYAGWDNEVVPIGNKMIQYINGECTSEDVAKEMDANQHLLQDNLAAAYTTVAEKLDTDDCARLVGICFGKASGADLALISKNKWYKRDEVDDLNLSGVSGSLFPLPVTDQEITTILPTGWRGNIQTVTLTGKRVKELVDIGYDKYGDGSGETFPYELVTPDGMTLDDDKTYKAAICGLTDEVAEEGNLQDTGILGLKAAQEYLSQFDTLSKKDLIWE